MVNGAVLNGKNADTAGKGRLRTAGGERSFCPAANRLPLPRNPRGGGGATGEGRGMDTGRTAGTELVVAGGTGKC